MLNANPTAYADLNAVLGELATTTRAILAGDFCGAYLQVSFAVGDADEHSDVDFVVVTHAEVSAGQEAALRRMHARFPAVDCDSAKHLGRLLFSQGRSAPARPFPQAAFIRRQRQSEVERSNHDNTAVVRWALREYGIALDGPDPASAVDLVTADELRAEVRRIMREKVHELRTSTGVTDQQWTAWLQPHAVLSFCRMLHTLSTGSVGSKRAAGHWALGALDHQWAPLIKRALDDRPDPWLRVHRPSDPAAIENTKAFVDYALQRAKTTSP